MIINSLSELLLMARFICIYFNLINYFSAYAAIVMAHTVFSLFFNPSLHAIKAIQYFIGSSK